MADRHKVFISYHHKNDVYYKKRLIDVFGNAFDGFVDKSVSDDDIDDNLPDDRVRQIIRDDFISDATVTIVLIGSETWKRKHVDWEIGSSIRDTKNNSRTGLIGIYLPTHPDFGKDKFDPHIMPPRLYNNHKCKFAKLYDWKEDISFIKEIIHEAFLNRNKINPDNSYPTFKKNKSGEKWQ
jgi:hypothetical protein